jgi:hypothetical protein
MDLAQRLPESERTVAGGQLGRDHEAAALEIEQHFAPRLGALPVAVGDRQQLLAAQLIGADTLCTYGVLSKALRLQHPMAR